MEMVYFLYAPQKGLLSLCSSASVVFDPPYQSYHPVRTGQERRNTPGGPLHRPLAALLSSLEEPRELSLDLDGLRRWAAGVDGMSQSPKRLDHAMSCHNPYRDLSTFSAGDWRHRYVGLEGPSTLSEGTWIPREYENT